MLHVSIHKITSDLLYIVYSKYYYNMFSVYLFSVSVGRTERSALRALSEQLYVHKSDLISAFQEFDPNNTGTLQRNNCYPLSCNDEFDIHKKNIFTTL